MAQPGYCFDHCLAISTFGATNVMPCGLTVSPLATKRSISSMVKLAPESVVLVIVISLFRDHLVLGGSVRTSSRIDTVVSRPQLFE